MIAFKSCLQLNVVKGDWVIENEDNNFQLSQLIKPRRGEIMRNRMQAKRSLRQLTPRFEKINIFDKYTKQF